MSPNASGLAFRIFVISGGGISNGGVDTGFNTSDQGEVAVSDNVNTILFII